MTQFLSVGGRVFLAMPVLHQLFAKVAKHLALRARGTVRQRPIGRTLYMSSRRWSERPPGACSDFRWL